MRFNLLVDRGELPVDLRSGFGRICNRFCPIGYRSEDLSGQLGFQPVATFDQNSLNYERVDRFKFALGRCPGVVVSFRPCVGIIGDKPN